MSWMNSHILDNTSFESLQTPTDDIEVINTERIEASPEVPVKDERRSQEVAETKSKGEERPTKTNLRKFFKLVRLIFLDLYVSCITIIEQSHSLKFN